MIINFLVNSLQNSAYDLKDNADAWRPACYPYDPASMAAYPYGAG